MSPSMGLPLASPRERRDPVQALMEGESHGRIRGPCSATGNGTTKEGFGEWWCFEIAHVGLYFAFTFFYLHVLSASRFGISLFSQLVVKWSAFMTRGLRLLSLTQCSLGFDSDRKTDGIRWHLAPFLTWCPTQNKHLEHAPSSNINHIQIKVKKQLDH